MNELELRDLERRLSASLHAAAPRSAPDLADRLLRRTAALGQRRHPFRLSFATALAAAAVLIAAVAVGLGVGYLLPQSPYVGDPSPSAITLPSGSPAVVPPTPSERPATPSPSEAAFPGGATCENDSIGFAVSYPADWWANEEVPVDDPALTPIPACLFFAEEPVELQPNAGLPPGIAITFSQADRVPPPSDGATIVASREETVDGRPALVREAEEGESGAPFAFPGQHHYTWFIELGEGRYLIAGTSSNEPNDPAYESHKRTLDRMVESLVLGSS